MGEGREHAVIRAALEAFIRAYANADGVDRAQTEIKLFEAWLRGCAALGITPSKAPPAVTNHG